MTVGRATIKTVKTALGLEQVGRNSHLVDLAVVQIRRSKNSRDGTVSRGSRDEIAGRNSGSSGGGGRAVD